MAELSRNKEDVRNAENDEERAYNVMQAWVSQDLRTAYESRMAYDRVCKELKFLDENTGKIRKRYHRSVKMIGQMSAYKGSLDSDEDAPMYDMSASDGEEEEENEEDMIRSAMQRAQSKHQVIVDKMMDMQTRQKTILKDVAEAKYKLKVAEASVEETWQAVKKPAVGEKKNSAVRSLLGATHTAGYFKHLSKYTEYYRLCTEARATWMSNNLLNSWGGVSFYIYFGPVEKQV